MDDKDIQEQMNEALSNQIKQIELFWNTVYTTYSFDERVGYWANSINQQMRWQAESGLDEYAIFNKEWYSWVKQKEPNFDVIMDVAFERFLSWNWNKDEYKKRISS